MSVMEGMGLEEKALLSVSNMCYWRGVQAQGWSFLVRRLRGATT